MWEDRNSLLSVVVRVESNWCGNFLFLWRPGCVMWFFVPLCFWKLSYEGLFCWGRCIMFFWKQTGKRVSDCFLEQMLERTKDVWKGFKYNPTNSGIHLSCYSLLLFLGLCWYWSLLTMVWPCVTLLDFQDDSMTLVHLSFFDDNCLLRLDREKFTKELLMIFWQLLAVSTEMVWLVESFFWIELPLLISEWCLPVDWADSADFCELKCWYHDNKYRISPKYNF